ncbi:hypothetical protein PFISCL1PPCAC_22975, partial [Pristionchus fissidentatus]
QMSDDGEHPVESPQDYQPQSPLAEEAYVPQSPVAQAEYDENAPVSPTPEEDEENNADEATQESAGDEDEESQEQPNSPHTPAEVEEEEEKEEFTARDEEGSERGEEENVNYAPVSPVMEDNEEQEAVDYAPASPAMDSGEQPVDEDSLESPSKARKRAIIDSDEEEEQPTQSGGEEEDEERDEKPVIRKRVLDSDESGDEKEGEDGEVVKVKKERIEGLEEDEGEGEADEQEVGNLMANIFGDESDEEGGGGGEGRKEKRAADSDEDMGTLRRDDEEGNMEWDFDVMLRNKKSEKKKRRKKGRDGGMDIINDDDGAIEGLVNAMKKAASEDRHSNAERRPATRKRQMLATVKTMLLKSDLVETMIDGGMMSAISEWLAPLPDKSLPALEIRSELLKILQGFARLDQGVLKQSGLGKAVMMLFKHPRETRDNKKLAHKLISDWARPIFQIDTDFRSMSREERMERDLAHMPEAKKRRMSSDDGPSTSSGKGGFKDIQEDLRPGMKGYIGRARVPKISSKDYVVRPASNVEGTFKGEKKSKGNERLDRATRDFKERNKAFIAKRAIGVSIEGRRMEI